MEHAEALKQLRALKIDWGRYDETHGHVYANQAFTRKLEGYGVTHFAEEYSGNQWNRLWTPHGRVERDLLPFFAEFLEGAESVSKKSGGCDDQRRVRSCETTSPSMTLPPV